MRVFKNHLVLKVTQGIRAFANEETYNTQVQRLKWARRRLARQGRVLAARVRHRRSGGEAGGVRGVRVENIVWIFGAGRTGSTWLAAMMGELRGHTVWFEPWVGALFDPYHLRLEQRKSEHFILSPHYRKTWLGTIRSFVLDGIHARFPEVGERGYLVIKEPGGSAGAPLLMEALPESRMVLLVRDPRDVMASWIDARSEGGWRSDNEGSGTSEERVLRFRANKYLQNVGEAKKAYDAHEGRKVLVRYEELRADTLETMKRIYSALEIPIDEAKLIRAVEKHSWERIPEEEKGEGKFYRKAKPGSWRNDLTPEQAQIVERITAPLLQELYETGGARAEKEAEGVRAKKEARGVRAENIVWSFGAARTGSTWLAGMMEDLEGQTVWREPLVGALFGNLYYDRARHLIGNKGKHYILGDGYRDSWLSSIRLFVLKEVRGRFPKVSGSGNYLVVQEPNGSLGAPLLMAALPESRMILLVRDPRDAVASSMDARRTGGWRYESRRKWEPESPVDKDPYAFLRIWSNGYLHSVSLAKQAYDAHEGRKVLVRYEDLRADTLDTMKRMYSELGILVDDEELLRVVEKHSWENISEEEKGEGKFYRKASPGSWREDLTAEQAEIVERITAPLLEEFYPNNTS